MQNAQKLQENLTGAYQSMASKNKDKLVEGQAGGGMVKAFVNLKLEVVKVEPTEALFNEQPGVVCELIVSAVNSALKAAQSEIKEEMMAATKQMGLPENFMKNQD